MFENDVNINTAVNLIYANSKALFMKHPAHCDHAHTQIFTCMYARLFQAVRGAGVNFRKAKDEPRPRPRKVAQSVFRTG